MDWNGNVRSSLPFVSRPENSFSFLYNYTSYDHFPGLHMKSQSALLPAMHNNDNSNSSNSNNNNQDQNKKKRLTNDQLDSLENSFQEEIKLDPDRKMKLAKELGLQPRQIAVWFQNRRARWKAKQLEHLCDELKQKFDAVNREKQKLQEEVSALRAILKEQLTKKPVSMAPGYTEVSGEETVESTSIPSSGKSPRASIHQIAECNYSVLNVDDYNPVMTPYWDAAGSLPPCP